MSDKGTPFRTRPADPVRVQADCGHSFEVPRSEYGDGSVYWRGSMHGSASVLQPHRGTRLRVLSGGAG